MRRFGKREGGDDAPDWTRTSMPIKAQALNLLCIPNSTTGASCD